MAVSDVTVKVNGNLPLTPIGVSISYAVNSVPVCSVEIDPTTSAFLQDPDSYKRQGTITVDVSVKQNSIQFIGMFDGLSFNQSVGGIGLCAILKGQAQLLLEADTIIPGLSPYGMNPFKIVQPFALNTSTDPSENIANLILGSNPINFANTSMADTYKQLALASLTYQTSNAGFANLISAQTGLDVSTLKDVIESPDRQAKLKSSIAYLQGLDTSNLSALQAILNTGDSFNAKKLLHGYITGPRMLWENLVEFYGELGAILIPGNSKIIVAPNNGFITFPHTTPGIGQHSTTTNAAYPADYNSTNYNDQGYVDVGYVALIAQLQNTIGSSQNFSPMQGGYPAKGAGPSGSSGAALLVVEANPLVFQAACGYFDKNVYDTNTKDHQPLKTTNSPGIVKITTFSAGKVSTPSDSDKTINDQYKSKLASFGDNYAELKFLQARYGDRMGSITLNFNPNWCPGTVGTLFSRGVGDSGSSTQGGSGIFIDFFVQRVTHRISLSAPNSGTATTTIDFNCGRLGVKTFSIDSDKLYEYDYGKVQSVQSTFLEDIGANTGS